VVGGEKYCAVAASVTRDCLPQVSIEEAVQGAPERAAVGAFGWPKTTLTDERLDLAAAQLNGYADEPERLILALFPAARRRRGLRSLLAA
jgi:hypothetical protein